MLLVILGIGLVILGIGIFVSIKFDKALYYGDKEWVYIAPITVGAIILVISLIVMAFLGASLSGQMVIDEKIALYQEENTQIEDTITTIVEGYKEYESSTLKEFKYDNPEVLFTLYPELKSNELVKKQMELYISNNQTIKSLNVEKLNYKPIAWWLYFG